MSGGPGDDAADHVSRTSGRESGHHDSPLEQHFRDMLDALPIIVWSSLADGHVDFINETYVEFIGGDKSAVEERGWATIVHPDDREVAFSRFSDCMSEGRVWECELRLRRNDGQYRWYLSRCSPRFDAHGRIVRWLGTSTDINDQKVALDMLRSERELLRLSMAVAGAAAWEWDAETDTAVWTDEMYDLHELPRGAKDPLAAALAMMAPEDADALIKAIDRSKKLGAPFNVEGELVLPSKGPRWFHSQGTPIRDTRGKLVRFVGITVDATERKTREDELDRKVRQHTADLRAANLELEGFTYSVSHDLRAPLRAINSTSAMLRQDFGELLPPEASALLARQALASSRLGKLIDDLLRLSRISRSEMMRTPIDMSDLALEIAADLRRDGRANNIEFAIEPGLSAEGDGRLMRLALQNLLENACKFSTSGGQVRFGQDGNGSFFVADQGIGFDPDYASKLFRPFERLVGDEIPGNGVGLANVKRIVERHGGMVWAHAAPGMGATFFFTVPAADRSDGTADNRADAVAKRSGKPKVR